MKPWQYLLLGVLIGLLAVGTILLISQPVRGVAVTLQPAPTPTPTAEPKPTATPAPILVEINGQVVNPGVYAIEKDARLMDLISKAGGLTVQADKNRVNNVFILRDGDYFYIPASDENIPETARNAPGRSQTFEVAIFNYPLNLNTTSQEALETLPGIGPTKAQDIIAFREKEGLFNSLEELLNVPGIGPTTLESIREYLIIEP